MQKYLNLLLQKKSLSASEVSIIAEKMIEGDYAPEQVAAFLIALESKGYSTEEVVGFASQFRKKMIPVTTSRKDLIDCCGTGGDQKSTFNISTAVAFVLAGAGLGVAKHGNRSVSSGAGSADVLEELHIPIILSPQEAQKSLEQKGFAFLFAPHYHPAFKKIVPIRKNLGIKTIFNILGPLLNPAKVAHQIIGVAGKDRDLLKTISHAVKILGLKSAMVLSASDGCDELSLSAENYVEYLHEDKIVSLTISPQSVGLKTHRLEEIQGKDARRNAKIIYEVLSGVLGPHRDVVLLNAAAGLLIMQKAPSLQEGVIMAAKIIDDGKAMATLKSVQL